jgi:hypothetical protein
VHDGILWLASGAALLGLSVWGGFTRFGLTEAEKRSLPTGRRELARLADSGHRVMRCLVGVVGALGLAEGILLVAGASSASASADATNRVFTAVVDGAAGFVVALALASVLAGPLGALRRRRLS